MTTILTRAAGWLLNRLPPSCAALMPAAVVAEALQQMHAEERLPIALARAELVIRELTDRLEQLQTPND